MQMGNDVQLSLCLLAIIVGFTYAIERPRNNLMFKRDILIVKGISCPKTNSPRKTIFLSRQLNKFMIRKVLFHVGHK